MTGSVTVRYKHECEETTTDQHFEVEVEFKATGGSAGCTYGPPEMCEAPEPPEIEYTGYTLLSYVRRDARKDSGNPVVEEWDGKDEKVAARYLQQFVALLEKGGKLEEDTELLCVEAAVDHEYSGD